MQRNGFDGKRLILRYLLPSLILLFILFFDQWTKHYFENFGIGYSYEIIEDFFRFYVTHNSGAAFSMLSGQDWAQTFFIVLTVIALVVFIVFYYFISKKYRFIKYGTIFIIAGTIGNFIDRVRFGYVVDFISFTFFKTYNFAIFNIADTFLCIGVAIVVFHFLFLDDNAIFKKKKLNASIN